MEFQSMTHALHYAKGINIDIVFINNEVIDVTQFKHSHPGGEESINQYINQDVTEMYYKISAHLLNTAIKELRNFKIGYIKTDKNNQIINEDLQDTDKDYKIDLNKGTIYQVFKKLNKEEYLAFIHDPKHMIDPPDAIMFDTPFLEIFTKTAWYIIPIVYIPLIIYMLYDSYAFQNLLLKQVVICFFVGVFLWTLMEYILHRFVFHIDENLPDNQYAILLHYLLHGIHHAFPMDRYRLVLPPILGIILIMIIKYSYIFLFDEFSLPFEAGTLFGYVLYDMTHYFIHHITFSGGYYKFLKKYHVLHHYKNPSLGFGVSQHFWDKVFGTVLLDSKGFK